MPSLRMATAMYVACAAFVSGCGSGATGAADAAQAAQAARSGRSVRYTLTWTPDATPVGQPRIVKAQFKTWSLQLVPCAHAPSDVSGWSWIAPAWADHGAAVDPSLWIASATEVVPAVDTAGLSPVREVSGTPCELLWVVSPGPPANGAKTGDSAFSAELQWTDSGGIHQRQVATAAGHGRLMALGALPAGAQWTVQLLRSSAGLLDGLDLAGADTETLAWTVLDRLVHAATVQVQ